MRIKNIPVKVGAIALISLIWILISFFQWGMMYKDISQLIFGVLIGLAGLYIAYDQWYKTKMDMEFKELEQMCDSFLNWKLKHDQP